jgi:hypothetical protein
MITAGGEPPTAQEVPMVRTVKALEVTAYHKGDRVVVDGDRLGTVVGWSVRYVEVAIDAGGRIWARGAELARA